MNTIRGGISKSDHDTANRVGEDRFLEEFVAAFARTGEFRRIVRALAPGAVEVWAGKSKIKRMITRPVAKSIERGFSGDGDGSSPVTLLLEDGEFLRSAAREIPVILNGVLRALESATAGAAGLPPEERAIAAEDFVGGIDFSSVGRLLTGIGSMINGLHESNPRFFNDTLRSKIVEFIENTDFGELKEALDGSLEDVTAFVKTINEELWKYPAKFVCILSAIPALMNMIVSSARETVVPINRLAPDLLTDVVLSLLGSIDGKNVGRLVNEFCELVRKIYTGSALLGDPGKPAFPGMVAKLAGETLGAMDIKLMLKARDLLGEIKEMSLLAFMSIGEQSPELARDLFRSHFRSLAAFFRRWSHKADAFENLFSDDDVAEEFALGMGEIDAQEVAVTVSRMCGIFNRVREKTPGIIRNTVAQTVSSLDSREVAETARWFTADMVEALKPLAPEILPPVIRGIADIIKLEGESDEMKDAMDYLRSVLTGKEAAI